MHLNSLQLVGGSVVFSMRHTDAAYKIDYSSKEIVWKLGGTRTARSLTLARDQYAQTSFGGPHFARQHPDGSVTVHDNGTERGRAPRAVRYRIDEAARTATLVEQIVDPTAARPSICCGSAQKVADGGWLMSWGGINVITEFAPGGSRRFSLTLGPKEYSYRVFPVARGRLSRRALRAGMDTMHPPH